MHDHRRPHVDIPTGARPPINPSPSARNPWPIQQAAANRDGDAQHGLANPWDDWTPSTAHPNGGDFDAQFFQPSSHMGSSVYSNRPGTSDGYFQSDGQFNGSVPMSSGARPDSPRIAFPEPQLFRSTSQRSTGPPIHDSDDAFHRTYSYRPPAAAARPGSSLHPNAMSVGHSRSKSDLTGIPALSSGTRVRREPSISSFVSTASSYALGGNEEYSEEYATAESGDDRGLTSELSRLSLDSDQNLALFQRGELPEQDKEWHKLVPPEARDALGKHEVQRQSVLFEIFKSEQDYVADLEAVQEVFVNGLRRASPPIIPRQLLDGFISQVFGNLPDILAHHQRMLAALFERQRDQHPLVQSVADIVLDTALNPEFRNAYTTYIKHYPLAESHHRRELKRNPAYSAFVHAIADASATSSRKHLTQAAPTRATSGSATNRSNTAGSGPPPPPPKSPDLSSINPAQLAQIRKRDLITFLSRPVTRLPRLNLLLSEVLKHTKALDGGGSSEYNDGPRTGVEQHPDIQTLPLILEVVGDLVRETQPGIEAAEGKVRFWTLCENLISRPGEIIDMDLYDESRTLVHDGPVSRRMRLDTGFTGWAELQLALLDNYLLLTKEEKRSNGMMKRLLVSRPLPLSYLRLGSFNAPPETRREKAEVAGGLLDSLRRVDVPLYPFTVFHASSRSTRRYTLYTASEASRKKWERALVDAIGVNHARDEGAMWFAQKSLSEKFFRALSPVAVTSRSVKFTGRVTAAVPFASGGRNFIAVSCTSGIYVGPRGEEKFVKVLNYANPTSIAAIQTLGNKAYNKFLVHYDTNLFSYSLDLLARVALGQAQHNMLDASLERLAGSESHANTGNVLFVRHAVIGQRMLVIYASKRTLGVSLSLNVLEALDAEEAAKKGPRRFSGKGAPVSFTPYGEVGYIPKDAYDLTALVKMIGICTHDGIVIGDPNRFATSQVSVVPEYSQASTNKPMADLKARTDIAKPLGLVRVNDTELLMVYDSIGCYIHKHGKPSRSSGYVKWETTATSYAVKGQFVLLFSPNFIEIREAATTRLVQVIEGTDIRLLHCGPKGAGDDNILVAMREKPDSDAEKIVALEETVEIKSAATPVSGVPSLWDEWDM
ncbi:hypothetical protein HGRIS_003941 [Hohenbuehelia grisea]|uniref:Uncharacterized protein n=1 Tax=Hohenbuehelia grisea TaxID=104357 RepID=A0ABR3JI02_9AGAR